MPEHYRITITNTGTVVVDVLNGEGTTCGRIIPRLADALGGRILVDHKPEYYANDCQTEHTAEY